VLFFLEADRRTALLCAHPLQAQRAAQIRQQMLAEQEAREADAQARAAAAAAKAAAESEARADKLELLFKRYEDPDVSKLFVVLTAVTNCCGALL
jgi:hypothetical protein